MRLIRPDVLDSELPHGPWSCRGRDIWETFLAAASGDAEGLRRLLARDPNLYRAEYAYTQPLDLAVREGRLETVEVLLQAGADPALVSLDGEDLVTAARDRGHEAVALLLESERARRGRPDAGGGAHDFEPIDHAIWDGPYFGVRGDLEAARDLLSRGAAYDTAIAAAFGDLEGVRRMLDRDPARIAEARPCGKRALSTAVQLGHPAIARLLLSRGADPRWPESAIAPHGLALHAAARAGDQAMVELLLEHGADPNDEVDSSGSATFAARTPELRQLLMARGGVLDPYSLIFLDEDDEALRLVERDPRSADLGCGGALAAACKLGKRELLARLLAAGARVSPVVSGCRSYLLCDPEMLRLLLASGMDPDLPDWQRRAPLHDLCARDGRGRPRPERVACAEILLDAGAAIAARDEAYRSTPLGWAARNGLLDMVELLLARGAPARSAEDEPWAVPLAWAERRGHAAIARRLREAGSQ